MYQKKYDSGKLARARRRRHVRRKRTALLLALSLISVSAIGGTMAYLIGKTDPVENTFEPAKVSCEVEEKFDGQVKEEVTVKNTSNIDAYLRVKLISYRVDGNDNHRIGGEAKIPSFKLGEGWVKYPAEDGADDYYYYTKPVAPGQTPDKALIDKIELIKNYEDVDGGRQVIEVMAEAIQSVPDKAVGEAWGVKISEGKVEKYTPGGGNE